jgi:hypothetical protein
MRDTAGRNQQSNREDPKDAKNTTKTRRHQRQEKGQESQERFLIFGTCAELALGKSGQKVRNDKLAW